MDCAKCLSLLVDCCDEERVGHLCWVHIGTLRLMKSANLSLHLDGSSDVYQPFSNFLSPYLPSSIDCTFRRGDVGHHLIHACRGAAGMLARS